MSIDYIESFDVREVATAADPVSVATSCGISITDGMALCPFHAEGRPSFTWFIGRDAKPRWQCHGCGWQGDCIDLVRAVSGCNGTQAIERVALLSADGAAFSRKRRALHSTRWAHLVASAHARLDRSRLAMLVPTGATDWVSEHFWLGNDTCGNLIMPHCDASGVVLAVKARGRSGEKRAWAGSSLSELYGRWRFAELPSTIVLTEGESDTWSAAWHLQFDNWGVLGAPRGAMSGVRPEWLMDLYGRRVYITFDGDETGRAGALRWAAALGSVADVRLPVLPDGSDVRELGRDALYDALRDAREWRV